jgi:hypothetical protein
MFSKEYLAGIVDGEGCLRFGQIRGTLHPAIYISNTNLEFLEKIKKQYGGSIFSNKVNQKRHPTWKIGYQWRVTSKLAINFLQDIGKFLFIKRKQKFLLFAWDQLKPGRGKQFNEAQKHLLLQKMAEYNKKGQ